MNNLKGVLRSATAMFLFVGLFGIWMGGCETQEQKVEKLIKRLEHNKVKVPKVRLFNKWEVKEEQQEREERKYVRANAALALGQIGPEAKDAVPALIQALKDENKGVRYRAVVTLGWIGPEAKGAVPALIQTLKGQDEQVGANVVFALGEIGTPEALKAIEEYKPQQ